MKGNVCKAMKKEAVPPRMGCDCPVLLWFPPLYFTKVQEQHLAQLAALTTSACSSLADSLFCQPGADQSCGGVLPQCRVCVSACLLSPGAVKTSSDQSARCMGLQGKKGLAQLYPLWDSAALRWFSGSQRKNIDFILQNLFNLSLPDSLPDFSRTAVLYEAVEGVLMFVKMSGLG